MLKMRAGTLVVLGLSDENVKRLQEGQPILFDGAEVGLPGIAISIMHGQTEDIIATRLNNIMESRSRNMR